LSEENGVRHPDPQHADRVVGWRVLASSLGSGDPDFFFGLLGQLPLSPEAGAAERELNFMLSVIKDIKPKHQLESMLAAQMAVVHLAMMKSGQSLMNTDSQKARQMSEGACNRFARTFAAQLEALKRYRTGGEQKITVQHVQNVAVDGPAIVGNVTHTGSTPQTDPASSTRAAAESTVAPPALTYAPEPTMPITEAPRTAPFKHAGRRRRSSTSEEEAISDSK
jgi:hypothetical protein